MHTLIMSFWNQVFVMVYILIRNFQTWKGGGWVITIISIMAIVSFIEVNSCIMASYRVAFLSWIASTWNAASYSYCTKLFTF